MGIWLIIYVFFFIIFLVLWCKNQNLNMPIWIDNINFSKVYKDENEYCAIPTFNVLRLTSPKDFLNNT
jgi:hypothetical protein